MKKEKTIKTYQRRTKSGKIVTVRQHTASYDAADKAKEVSKRKGAGEELEKVKSMKAVQKLDLFDGYDFTEDDFKEWYEGTGSVTDKKVAKALRKALGRKAYDELNDLAANNYKKGGASSFFKKNVHSKNAMEVSKSGKETSKENTTTKEKGSKDLKNDFMKSFVSADKLLRESRGFDRPGSSLRRAIFKAISKSRNRSIREVEDFISASENYDTLTDWGILKNKLYDEFLKERKGAKTTTTSKTESSTASKPTPKPTSKNAEAPKKPKGQDLSNVSGQVSYVRKLAKKLPEDKRKSLAPFLSRASTGQISTQSLWNTYQKLRSNGKRYMPQPAPWDKRAFEDLANSD